MISALTLLDLDELMARYANYENFAHIIRKRFTQPKKTLHVEKQKSIIMDHWNLVCDEAKINEVDKKLLWQRQFLNPFALHL